MMLSAVTLGAEMALSRGTKFSEIGMKLSGATATFEGQKIAELSGRALIKAHSLKIVTTEVLKTLGSAAINAGAMFCAQKVCAVNFFVHF